ncbi:MAG: hypothetical protein ACI4UK_00580 [Floccifex sp.]
MTREQLEYIPKIYLIDMLMKCFHTLNYYQSGEKILDELINDWFYLKSIEFIHEYKNCKTKYEFNDLVRKEKKLNRVWQGEK